MIENGGVKFLQMQLWGNSAGGPHDRSVSCSSNGADASRARGLPVVVSAQKAHQERTELQLGQSHQAKQE
jgi:hypothetical protein